MDDALTAGARQLPNERARASVVSGALAVAALPAGLALAAYSSTVDLTESAVAIPLAGALGIAAIVLARSARRRSELTLGRVGGLGLARTGSILGILGIYLAVMAALSVGFFGLLLLFQ